MLDKTAAIELKNYILNECTYLSDLTLDNCRTYAACYVVENCSRNTNLSDIFSEQTIAYCYGFMSAKYSINQ
jgi:hypothetical protein